MRNIEYLAPAALDDALTILKQHKNGAKVLAGGTDLLVQMKSSQIQPQFVVDVKKIPEFNRLEWNQDEGLHVGAAVPLSKLAAYQPLREKFKILAQACSMIGSIQIRNRATMGGNICNAAPSADTPPPLLCLEAKAIVASLQGTRTIPMEKFFNGPGQTALKSHELLVEVQIPNPQGLSAGCYLRHTPRAEMDIAVVGVGTFLVISPQDDQIQDARIALGAVAPTPVRATGAEGFLRGKTPTKNLFEEVAEGITDEIKPITDVRGTEDFRFQIAKVLTLRTLSKVCNDLGIKL